LAVALNLLVLSCDRNRRQACGPARADGPNANEELFAVEDFRGVLRVALRSPARRAAFSDRFAASSRHVVIVLLSAFIVATFSRRARRCGIGATVNARSRGHDPRDWHREL